MIQVSILALSRTDKKPCPLCLKPTYFNIDYLVDQCEDGHYTSEAIKASNNMVEKKAVLPGFGISVPTLGLSPPATVEYVMDDNTAGIPNVPVDYPVPSVNPTPSVPLTIQEVIANANAPEVVEVTVCDHCGKNEPCHCFKCFQCQSKINWQDMKEEHYVCECDGCNNCTGNHTITKCCDCGTYLCNVCWDDCSHNCHDSDDDDDEDEGDKENGEFVPCDCEFCSASITNTDFYEQWQVPRALNIERVAGDFYTLLYLHLKGYEPAETKFQEFVGIYAGYFARYADLAVGGELRHCPRMIPEGFEFQPEGSEIKLGHITTGRGMSRSGSWCQWKGRREHFGMEALDMAYAAFTSMGFNGFGGHMWANITDNLRLYLSGQLTPVLFIDLAFGMEHNGGRFMNKLPEWGYHEMMSVLDANLRGDIDTVKQYASPEVRILYGNYTSELSGSGEVSEPGRESIGDGEG